MVTVLDTRELAGRDRRPAAVAARFQEGMASRLVLPDPTAPLDVRLEAWDVHGVPLLRSDITGRLSLDSRRPGTGDEPVVSLFLQEHGTGRHEQGGVRRELPPGHLAVTELTSAYTYAWGRDAGAGRALQITVTQLGLPVDVIRRATPRAGGSPLYDLVRGHLRHVTDERLARDSSLAPLAGVTVELARALLASVAGSDATASTALAETLVPRVRTYVRQHLRDPGLDAARIAAAHAVSVRHLYRLCRDAGFSLEQSIIEQRLAGARAELAARSSSDRSIAMVARRWGFADPSHFTRRFREAFGTTPRDWRAGSAAADAQRVPR